MDGNIYWFFIAALVPLITGSLWYNPKFGFGKAWITSTGLTEEQLRGGNMVVIFLLSYIFGLFLCAILYPLCVHQVAIGSLFVSQPGYAQEGSEIMAAYTELQSQFGRLHRSFGHGALHGAIAAIGLALPVIGINGMFERKGWKYISLHTGYWILTFSIMGGLIAQYV